MDPLTQPQPNISATLEEGGLSYYQYFIGSPLLARFSSFDGNDRKIFLGEYVKLSSSLRNYIASTDTASMIIATGVSYNLDESQVSKIAETIRELIIGKIFIKDFPVILSSKLSIDNAKAGEIVNKIVSQTFGPIIEDVKRMQRTKFPDKVMSMQKASQPPTTLNQPAARREPIESARPNLSQQTQPAIPTPIIPPKIEIKPPLTQPQSVRPNIPPLTRPMPSQPAPIQQNLVRPITPQQPKPPLQQPSMVPPRPLGEVRSEGLAKPPLQQFKMPDLGLIKPAPKKSVGANKSLEEELEKVASVIDLRPQSKE